jgi:hypothetical protein
MSTERDDPKSRQTRLEWMINEFQEAQRRRLVKANDGPIEPRKEGDTTEPSPARQSQTVRQ